MAVVPGPEKRVRERRMIRAEQGLLAQMFREERNHEKRSLMFEHMIRLIEREKELLGASR